MQSDLAALEALPMPRTRAELLERIPPARAALEAAIRPLTLAQLAAPGPEGWAVKDHLAHLAAWERMMIAHRRDGSDHTVAQLDKAAYDALDTDAINGRLYQLHRDRSPADVLGQFVASRRDILALIDGLSDDDLTGPYWEDEPACRPVIEKLAGDTYRHDLEHLTWIRELLAHLGRT